MHQIQRLFLEELLAHGGERLIFGVEVLLLVDDLAVAVGIFALFGRGAWSNAEEHEPRVRAAAVARHHEAGQRVPRLHRGGVRGNGQVFAQLLAARPVRTAQPGLGRPGVRRAGRQ